MKTKSSRIVRIVITGSALLLATGASLAGTLHFSPTSILPYDGASELNDGELVEIGY